MKLENGILTPDEGKALKRGDCYCLKAKLPVGSTTEGWTEVPLAEATAAADAARAERQRKAEEARAAAEAAHGGRVG